MLFLLVFCFFFFKQKTAYEMRISDWSSDVCSSDLLIWRGNVLDIGYAQDDHTALRPGSGATWRWGAHRVCRSSTKTSKRFDRSGRPALPKVSGLDRKSTRLNSRH